ncbi:SNF2-related protein [Beauveria brongniartii RCEF 3172]|uniref:SNF2-related protein n=1 Tax=Beauveria brongniartii RCEF 3172 TaxID=1081107 RepID=A0A166ZCD3_9HYPO|nr:SNF2-related protein [Beauveria brongniartii RCEF 3172]
MATPSRSQEMNTLREEIGFQRAILASLAEAQDADSKSARISARRDIQLLTERLQKIEGSDRNTVPGCPFITRLAKRPEAVKTERSSQPLRPPATPISLPTRKRDFGHRGSPTSPGLHPKSQKTTPMSVARGKPPKSSMDDILDSDDLEVIDLTGYGNPFAAVCRNPADMASSDDIADTTGYIAAQIQQEKMVAQSQRDRGFAKSLQQSRIAANGSRDPQSDPLQRLMQTARTNGAPRSGFQDSSELKVEYPGQDSKSNISAAPSASASHFPQDRNQNDALLHSLRMAEQYRLQSIQRLHDSQRRRQLNHGLAPGHSLPGAFPGSDMFNPYSQYGPSVAQPPRHVLGSTTWPGMPIIPSMPVVPSMGVTSTMDVINRTKDLSYSNAAAGFGFPPVADRMRHFLDLTQPQEKMSDKELDELLQNIRPDEEIPLGERNDTVEGLKVNIYHHQQLALKWMQAMEDGSNKGGILADDMGLGKTISALALMVTRRATSRPKTNLIIGPLSLVRQWEEEICTKVSASHKMSVFVYHNKKVTTDELLTYDVVLTTYGTIAAELKRLDTFVKENAAAQREPDYNSTEVARKFPLLHPTKAKYHRIILDEAQCIKNRDTQTAKACHRLRANFRWCLTGTPMMNGVLELYSLLAFLRIRPYCAWDRFRQQFGVLFGKKGDEKSVAMSKLRALLKAIMLRRKKNSMLDGKPILELPEKTEMVVYAELSTDERDYYNQLEKKAQVLFSKYLREGSVGRNYSNILVLLLRLRQACCHPHLNLDVTDNAPVTENEVLDLIKELQPGIVARIKAAESFECPICYDAVPSPQFFIPCGHDSCSQCLSRLADNATSQNIQEGHESDKCKCPVCRGQFNPKQCFTLEAFRKVHMPEALKAEEEDESEEESEDESDEDAVQETDASDDDIYSDDAVDAKGNLANFVVDDHFFSDSDDDTDTKPDVAKIKAEGSSADHKVKSEKVESDGVKSEEDEHGKEELRKAKIKEGKRVRLPKAKKPKKNKSKGKTKDENEKVIKLDIKPSMLKELRLEARKSREAYRKYMAYLRQTWLPAAKVSECIRLLEEADAAGRKSIVFSQWTLLLDLIEVGLDHAGFQKKPKRYDGGMSGEERNAVAKAFQNPARKDVTVMLVSLRAGNAGLNLTQATRVIIMDPFWNPYIEMQAVDRAYRIGQKQPVEVFRILTKETVEDRIVELKEKKQAIVEAALDEAESAKIGRLGVSELKFLFNRRDE